MTLSNACARRALGRCRYVRRYAREKHKVRREVSAWPLAAWSVGAYLKETNSLMEDVEATDNEESQNLGPADGRQSLKKEMTKYYDRV